MLFLSTKTDPLRIIFPILTALFLLTCSPSGNTSFENQFGEQPAFESSHIAFLSNRTGNGDIYIIAMDGSGLERVTWSGESEYAPRWTKDGLVYASQTVDGEFLIKKYHRSLAEKVVCPNPAFQEVPEWSPDGRWMVFTQKETEGSNLYLANANGIPIRQLTKTKFEDKQPSFSPDGTKVVFSSNRSGAQDIWLLDLEKLSVRNLTAYPAQEGHPRWSPRGDKILFSRIENGNADLFSMNPDGTEVKNVTNSPANELTGAFSPDGKFIAYSSSDDGNQELFVANADGSHARQLTFDPAFDGDTVWVPAFFDTAKVKQLFKQL